MFNPTQGPARETIDRAEMQKLRSSVIVDDRRRRPLYFDGRFLAARDLVREQTYFLTRQADLGRAGGAGVVHGLMVRRGPSATTFTLSPGHGITAAGELVVVPTELRVDVADVPQIQRLDAALGLIEIPREPARNRSGLFVVALRPVEFAANPISSYPTSIEGQRTVEFGDIVEGAVVTLIPYPDDGTGSTAEARRSRAAYDIFVNKANRAMTGPVLPLAMVALSRGVVQWVDPFLVRREVGADHGDVLGLGFAPRVLRESHLLQYDHQLREVLASRGSRGQRFAATEYFQALPPGGRMPAAAIDANEFTQIFFPPTVEVDLSIVPSDEVTALLEESLLLPPLDLSRKADELDSTSVLVMIPVPRGQFRVLQAQLGGAVQRPLQSAAPWMVARRNPLDVLRGLRIPPQLVPYGPLPDSGSDTPWRTLLAATPLLWYVRRRNLQYRGDVTGVPLLLQAMDGNLFEGGIAGGLAGKYSLTRSAPPAALAGAEREGAAERDAPADTAPAATGTPGAAPEEERDEASPGSLLDALRAAGAGGLDNPALGAGLAKLDRALPELKDDAAFVAGLARAGAAADLDRVARQLKRAELEEWGDELRKLGRSRAKTAPQRLARAVRRRGGGGGK